MTRKELTDYILETYPCTTDFPWESDPYSQVFRHSSSRKWFALIMNIPAEKLGLHPGIMLDVVNLKCDPRIIGSVRAMPGFFPAWHMCKAAWITAVLDGSADTEQLKLLVDMSYGATAPKQKKRPKTVDKNKLD